MNNLRKQRPSLILMWVFLILAAVLFRFLFEGTRYTFAQNSQVPRFAVRPELDWVDAIDWTPGAELFLTIDDPLTGESPDYTCSQVSPTGNLRFIFGDEFDVQAGHIVTLSDGLIIKEHVVTNLAITNVDVWSDTVSGTADPGDQISVWFHQGVCDVTITATADSVGFWAANFSGQCNIIPGSNGAAVEVDDDYDWTFLDWRITLPHFSVRPELDWVDASDWTPGTELVLTIDDPLTGESPDYTCSQVSPTGNLRFIFGDEFDVQAGHIVTLSDGLIIKEHVVTNLAITNVDVWSDTVSGTADPGDQISVWFHQGVCDVTITATADSVGFWAANFSGQCNIIPGSNGAAVEVDDDYDWTFLDWNAEGFTLEDLIQLIESMHDEEVDSNLKNSLIKRIETTIKSLERGNYKAAVGKLKSFINEVKAQMGKKISYGAANRLITYVQNLIAQIE